MVSPQNGDTQGSNRGQTYKWRWRHLQAQVAPLATSGGATSKFKWHHLLV